MERLNRCETVTAGCGDQEDSIVCGAGAVQQATQPLPLCVSAFGSSELTGPGDCKLDFQFTGPHIGELGYLDHVPTPFER
jgi:hypothetical protein